MQKVKTATATAKPLQGFGQGHTRLLDNFQSIKQNAHMGVDVIAQRINVAPNELRTFMMMNEIPIKQ